MRIIDPGDDPRRGIQAPAAPAPIAPPPAAPVDMAALIRAHPAYAAWQAKVQGKRNTLGTTRQQAIRTLVSRYGGLPKGMADTYGDITPEIAAAAGSDPYSAVNTLKRNYDLAVTSNQKALAARGALQSGELGHTQGLIDTAQGAAERDQFQAYSDAINAALSGYTTGYDEADDDEWEVINQVTPQVAAQYQPPPPPIPVTPPAPPAMPSFAAQRPLASAAAIKRLARPRINPHAGY